MFPIIELVDRYTIAKLKFDKTQANREELEYYEQALSNHDISLIELELSQLYHIHETIWSLESELKSGQEHKLSLEEIGRRAIMIRDWNNNRVFLKNRMANILGCQVREIKKDHLSE